MDGHVGRELDDLWRALEAAKDRIEELEKKAFPERFCNHRWAKDEEQYSYLLFLVGNDLCLTCGLERKIDDSAKAP